MNTNLNNIFIIIITRPNSSCLRKRLLVLYGYFGNKQKFREIELKLNKKCPSGDVSFSRVEFYGFSRSYFF